MLVDMRCFCFNVQIKNDASHSENLDVFTPSKKIKLFTYDEMLNATANFHRSNRIGYGGFGSVFKGTLKNGKAIAAKVLSAWSKQGINEFLAEIDTIANIKHPNLVELIGCCIHGRDRILVYEFLENRSLDRVLLGQEFQMMLDWSKRSAICIGTASGLVFLHEDIEPNIIHRDIKASNILLGKNFVPKIGDFGLAKLFPDNKTHISTRVAGTIGYLAPEYAIGGRLTKKVDIYSFGVLLLEIVSGRSNSTAPLTGTNRNLLAQAWRLYKEGRLVEFIDPNLKEYPEEEVLKFIKVALFCVQGAAHRRPLMPQVLKMLTHRIRINENELTPPGFSEYSLLSKADLTAEDSVEPQLKEASRESSVSQSLASDSEEDIPR